MSHILAEPICPFCTCSIERLVFIDELVMGIWDAFPVTEGHMLIVPRRHISSWPELSEMEQSAILRHVVQAQNTLTEKFDVSDFNVGFNQGVAAGQTVPHFHLHIIPRRSGDVSDPRGGVRSVIPNKANYLAEVTEKFDYGFAPHSRALIAGGEDSLLSHIRPHIDAAEIVDVAISFVMASGVKLLWSHFQDLLNRNGKLRIVTGDYMDVTDPSALRSLMDLEGDKELFVFETMQNSFHPKGIMKIDFLIHKHLPGRAKVKPRKTLSVEKSLAVPKQVSTFNYLFVLKNFEIRKRHHFYIVGL